MRPKKWGAPKLYLPAVRAMDPERFWSRVERKGESECWFVRSRREPSVHLAFIFEGSNYYYHRFSWAMHHNQEPGDLVVRHTCDNAHCVNPKHLAIGTSADNREDARSRSNGIRRLAPLVKWDGSEIVRRQAKEKRR